MDSRAARLATIFLDHSLRIKEGEKLLLSISDFTPMELAQECYRQALQRGAMVELDVFGVQRNDVGGFARTFLTEANETQLSTLSAITMAKVDWADAMLSITALHDDTYLQGIDPARVSLRNKAMQPIMEKVMPKRWVITQWPTDCLAKRAGMSLEEFTDFYYDACLIDYAAESERLKRLSDILDAGKRVHIHAPGTDLIIGIEGRLAAGTNTGRRNVPDGECFLGPEEHVTEGTITFELPQRRGGNVFEGIRLEFKEGYIERAEAKTNNDLFQNILNEHPDNRRLGELGIGMNRKIQTYIQNILFDEKIAGTIHMALGRAYGEKRGGGKNGGTIHWDLVKDLRVAGSLVMVDDTVIIRDGEVLV